MENWALEAPFSNVPADKPHPNFLRQFLERGAAYLWVFKGRNKNVMCIPYSKQNNKPF